MTTIALVLTIVLSDGRAYQADATPLMCLEMASKLAAPGGLMLDPSGDHAARPVVAAICLPADMPLPTLTDRD